MSEKTLHVKKMRAFGGLSASSAIGQPMALSEAGRATAAIAGVGQSLRAPMPEAQPRPIASRQGGFGEGRGRGNAAQHAAAQAPQAVEGQLTDKRALAFIDACERGDEPRAIKAIKDGLKVHAFGKDLLFAVCENGMSQALEALMARGLKPHGFAGPAFASALKRSHWPICERLIEAGFSPRASRGAWAEAFKSLSDRDQAEATRRIGPLGFMIGVTGAAQPASRPLRAPTRPRGREWTESELRALDAQVDSSRIEAALWNAGELQSTQAPQAFSAWAEWEEQAAAKGLTGEALELALDEAAGERLARLDNSQKRALALDDSTLDQLAKLQLKAIAKRDATNDILSPAEIDRRDRDALAAAQLIEPEQVSRAAGFEAFVSLVERQIVDDRKLAQDHRNAAHHTPGAMNLAATRVSAASKSDVEFATLDDASLDNLGAERLAARLSASRGNAEPTREEIDRMDREAASKAQSMDPRSQISRVFDRSGR